MILMAGLCLSASLQATIRYVDINGANPTFPYISWGTAATNIQAAVDATVDDDMVLVTNGTYYPAAEIVISNSITVKSVGGADVTIVDGGGSHRCFNMSSPTSVIVGFTVTNGYVTGAYPDYAGAGISCGSYTPIVSNCTFVGNTAFLGVGGGMFYGVANNCLFVNNSSEYGGGKAGGTANDCLFTNNVATGTETDSNHGNGGGLFFGTANRCTFSGNSALGDFGNGGGMGGGTANNCIFIGNVASGITTNGNGGGIFNGTANNCTFSGNSAAGDGGGMYLGSANNSIVWYNTATGSGDDLFGVTASYSCSPDATNGVGNIIASPLFIDRQHGDYHLSYISPCIDIGDNSFVVGATDLDGVVRVLNDTVDIGAFEFVPVHYVDVNGTNPKYPYEKWETAATNIQTAIDVSVNGNTVMVGTGTYYLAAEILVTNAITIKSAGGADLTTIDAGGTSRCFNLNNVECSLFGFKIINGYASGSSADDKTGGGIYASGSLPKVFNCVISSNSAVGDGGGMIKGYAYNSVFSHNSAVSGGGMSLGTLANCTLIYNSASVNGGGLSDGTARNSILWFNTADGVGSNMYFSSSYNSSSPGVSGAGNISLFPAFVDSDNDDFRLQSSSPCIDSGDNGWVVGDVDLDGEIRIVNGTVDMGAYESVTVHYVFVDGTNPVPPYATWQTAATNIQEGVDISAVGDTVMVGNGTYNLLSEIVVTNAITIKGYNGTDATFVDGGGVVRCFNLGTAACVIVDITITNGYSGAASGGGGVYCVNSMPVVSNCLFVKNSTESFGGGLYFGTAKNCRFISNTAKKGGGIYLGTGNNSIFIENSATEGGGMHSGTANNSVFTENYAEHSGGGIYLCDANNCTFTENFALSSGGGVYSGVINNSIVWNNRAGNDGDDILAATVHYTCSPDVEHGVDGNITNAPLLSSSSHIYVASPCAGGGSSLYSSGRDIDGGQWRNPPSMGCDEINSGTAGDLDIKLFVPKKIAYNVNIPVRSMIIGASDLFTVGFGDGAPLVSNQLQTVHSWQSTGVFDVVLSAYNINYTGGIFVTQQVEVIGGTQYVSVAGSDDDDGWFWIGAKRTIQAAVDASGYGGGILVSAGTYYPASEITVSNGISIFSSSQAGASDTFVDGGGTHRVFNLGSAACSINGFTIQNGNSLGGNSGGGVYCINQIPEILNCIFTGNSASGSGGGLYYGKASDCTFIVNSAKNGGGVAYSVISNCVVRNNRAEYGSGGGMYYGTAVASDFKYNIADDSGGGMYGGDVYSCMFLDNSAGIGGGGMYDGVANGSSFIRNVADVDGGGMKQGTVNNCTFIENSADNNGGGVSVATVNNSIAWYNTAFYDGDDLYSVTAKYSCSPDVGSGVDGNITNMPLLASASHLAVNSPCVGAGSSLYAVDKDIDGEDWAGPPSIGCDEYSTGTAGSVNLFLIMPVKGGVGASIPVTATVVGAASLSTVDFGDGTWATNQPHIDHTWSVAGQYSVVLTAFNNDYPAGVASTQIINIIDSVQHVSTTGSDAASGWTWGTAKRTVQAAVNAMDAYGGTVLITNGTYFPVAEIAVSNAMHISSVNGAAVTIVDGGGVNRCFNLDSADCEISGLTIANGNISAENGGGIYCANNVPLVSRCIFIGNSTDENGGGMYYGQVDNSIFRGNSGKYGGGIAKGIIDNCTIVANSASENGGGVYQGRVNNSIIWSNSAVASGSDQYSAVVHATCASADVTDGVDGNITNNPVFIDKAGFDYHLQTNSPCIDAGDNAFLAGTVGLEGIPRPLDSGSNGTAVVDMGAYEIMIVNLDSDMDDMPDGWEFDNGLNPADATDAAKDKDGDWYSNYSEYIAGTDPQNASSVFDLSYVVATNGFVINWDSVTSRRYTVLWTDDLLATNSVVLEADIDYPRGSYTDILYSVEDAGFYKVDVELVK